MQLTSILDHQFYPQSSDINLNKCIYFCAHVYVWFHILHYAILDNASHLTRFIGYILDHFIDFSGLSYKPQHPRKMYNSGQQGLWQWSTQH